MKGIFVDLVAETASLRDPGGQLYHSCLPLPSFSTMVGITGAAMGMAFEEALDFFRLNKIFAGTTGKSRGAGRDLWNYTKVVGTDQVRKDIVNREFLFGLSSKLFYASDNDKIIEQIRTSFLDPTYCITLGNSDDLAKIKLVSPCFDICVVETTDITGDAQTVVPGDVSRNYEFDWNEIKNRPLSVSLRGPMIKKLPVDYLITNRVRKGNRYETFSFVPEMVRLKRPLAVYVFGEYRVPMFSL